MRAVLIAATACFLGLMAGCASTQSHAHMPHAGETFRDCADCPQMVVVPAGAFIMGSPESEPHRYRDEGPQRQISFARNFAVGRFEITRGQYAAFVRATGRADNADCAMLDSSGQMISGSGWRNPGFDQNDDHPVVCVSWEDAHAYVEWLNTQTSGGYHLLSEAEWEYAARAGATSAYSWGSDASDACAYANGADATLRTGYPSLASRANNCDDGALYTSAAGSYRANAFGLFDMLGNAREWVEDCYTFSLDAVPPDGSAHEATGVCTSRLMRGGSGWVASADGLRAAKRDRMIPANRNNNTGFRVARTLP